MLEIRNPTFVSKSDKHVSLFRLDGECPGSGSQVGQRVNLPSDCLASFPIYFHFSLLMMMSKTYAKIETFLD